jgi:hypothetical protein
LLSESGLEQLKQTLSVSVSVSVLVLGSVLGLAQVPGPGLLLTAQKLVQGESV